MSSSLVTRSLVQQAFGIAAPSIVNLLHLSQRDEPIFVHLVVVEPVKINGLEDDVDILGEITLARAGAPPERSQWKRGYDHIALSKARISRRFKKDSGIVAVENPALLQPDDTFFEGGIYLAGVSVGGSGVESFLDEAAARCVATSIAALVKWKLRDIQRDTEKDRVFLP